MRTLLQVMGDGVYRNAEQLPWHEVPPEAAVEWDRDVSPHLERMPDDTTIYWECRVIADLLWIVVSFAYVVGRTHLWKSIYWRADTGWRSNYLKPTIAAELDWTSHP